MPPMRALAEMPRDELASGELFADRYEILETLGKGGMGTVYRARDLSLGEEIALKLLPFGQRAAPVAILRFRKEVKLARRVTHPNVARVYDIGEHLGELYLTMELVNGPTLRGVLRGEQRLAPARVIAIGRALAAGLSAAHEVGVVHRDLKPTNILIDQSGRVVLTDFGIARGHDDELSLTTGVIGTPHYMAPEQVSGGVIDARADIYAMGLVLYEMITGGRAAGTPELLIEAMRDHGAPPALITLTLHCLERDPGARPRSAVDVGHRLSTIAVVDHPDGRPRAPVDHPDGRPRAPVDHPDGRPRAPVDHPDGRPRAPVDHPDGRPRAPVDHPDGRPRAPVDDADGTGTRPREAPGAPMVATAAAVRVTGMPPYPSHPREITRERAVAVLPFIYRGGKDTDYLGDVITDELVDVLCRTRGLRVLGSGATSKYRDARDPRVMGRELEVFAVIDGTVQMIGQRVRLGVRLADADTGAQLWSDCHEGPIGDLFTFQEAIARRIAEELRVEITTITHKGDAPPEAIEQYLSARRLMRRFDHSAALAAMAGFERCSDLAPGFLPALAGHAIASLRAWFFDASEVPEVNWPEKCQASVDRALSRAPEIAETHLAAGMLATHRGAYVAAARALQRALVIAPTCPDAHEYLGLLECESGRGEAGERRLKLADALAPELPNALSALAHHMALLGRHEEALSHVATLEQRGGTGPVIAGVTRVRIAAWRGDRELLVQMAKDTRFPGILPWQTMRIYAQAMLGAFTAEEVEQHCSRLLGATQNPRRRSFASQLEVELFSHRGELDMALVHLMACAQTMLLDITWLDHCALLAPLRRLPGFAEAREVVQTRVDSIWAQ